MIYELLMCIYQQKHLGDAYKKDPSSFMIIGAIVHKSKPLSERLSLAVQLILTGNLYVDDTKRYVDEAKRIDAYATFQDGVSDTTRDPGAKKNKRWKVQKKNE